MGFLGGTFLKLSQTLLYAVEFCCAAVILGIYSFFLAWLHRNNVSIPTWEKAVEGLSGAACLYLIFAVLLTCFLGGVSLFAFLAIVLDVLFCGAFIAIAVLTRDGAHTCSRSATVHTPLGSGLGSTDINDAPSLSFVCRLNKTAFAVAIIGAGLFLISALLQLAIGRNHQREKRYGPSPANNYTSGSGRKWFNRRRGPRTTRDAYAKDAEAGAIGGGLAAPDHTHNAAVSPTHAGYHTAPTGTGVNGVNGAGVNPYGYDTARPTNF